MTDAVVIVVATSSESEAERIADRLIADRLAACVQISGPIASRYRWEGKIESSREWLCQIKTTAERFAAVDSTVRQMHSYDTPEILAVPVVAGSARYLDWLRSETAPSDTE